MSESKRVTVIGSSNVDMIMQLPHLPAVGETVTDGTFLQTYGGKGANQAVAAVRARGADTAVSFITSVGDDPFGHTVLENFRRDGMDVSHAYIASGVPTGSALVMFDTKGDNYLAVAPGANYQLTPEHIDTCDDLLRDSAMLVLQMEIPEETTLHILGKAEAIGVPVLFNFAPARSIEKIPISSRMNGLVVNEHEAAMLANVSVRNRAEAQQAAEALRDLGVSFVIVTLGSDGALLLFEETIEHIPAFSVTSVDTTAAGDAFCGALAVRLVEGKNLSDAVQFAQATAALSVTRMGAQPSLPHRAEIESFLTSVKE